ncbi:MmyB family transcriptional regulator [Streptomyces lancefieldiae]|uniref:Helix-turn-helix domain-containing protein n=1 Tax=Streptomyces lancefieldiae TaxID=3075520 RepID=A0ABU3B058_9ACTN|nr:helix-turn-helix domain-containing protein [Streptomyces sp. DSM 40712]MDT0615197.1 helix-turn-helix domain-containing protein [Streptomyces sp. DSM 40712]
MPDDQLRDRPQPTLTRILRRARQRVDPRRFPEVIEVLGPRSRNGLTQAEVAQLLSVSPKWYRNLELGKPLTYSKSLMERVRRILDLSEDEWGAVWQLTQGRTPSDERRPPASRRMPPPAVRRFIDTQPWPAYICDHRWDLIAYNKAVARDFPWVLDGTNVMMWALTHPEARTFLVDWEKAWAPALMAKLQLQAEVIGADAGLQSIIRAVEADAVARRLWSSAALPVVPHLSTRYPRKVLLPRNGSGQLTVTLLTAQVDDMPSCHMTVLVPAYEGLAASAFDA